MDGRWRAIGAKLLVLGRKAFPALVSMGLIAWLIHTISAQRLLEALGTVNWPGLVLATVGQLIALFLWDTVCVAWLFAQPDRDLPFRTVFRLRCDTVIWSAINLEIGQAAFAWKLARIAHVPLPSTLGYCVLLALVDIGTLLSLALAGSFVYPTRLTSGWRWICVVGLAVLGLLVLLVKLLPQRWRRRLAARPWAGWLRWIDWRSIAWLILLRLIMFLLVLVYAGIGLFICGVFVNPRIVVGIIPFVLMAESLPGTAGLGERETALIYLYPAAPEQHAVLLSFGLIWSTVVILGRIAISLISWCIPHRHAAKPSQAAPLAEQPPEGVVQQ